MKNAAGSASVTFDSQLDGHDGSLTVRSPLRPITESGYANSGRKQRDRAACAARVRIQLKTSMLYEDEEAVTPTCCVLPRGVVQGIDPRDLSLEQRREQGKTEVNSYDPDVGGASTTIVLTAGRVQLIWSRAMGDDDQVRASERQQRKNRLARLALPLIRAARALQAITSWPQHAPTNDNTGYVINLSIDVLPGAGQARTSQFVGLEVTQRSALSQWLGADKPFRSSLARSR